MSGEQMKVRKRTIHFALLAIPTAKHTYARANEKSRRISSITFFFESRDECLYPNIRIHSSRMKEINFSQRGACHGFLPDFFRLHWWNTRSELEHAPVQALLVLSGGFFWLCWLHVSPQRRRVGEPLIMPRVCSPGIPCQIGPTLKFNRRLV